LPAELCGAGTQRRLTLRTTVSTRHRERVAPTFNRPFTSQGLGVEPDWVPPFGSVAYAVFIFFHRIAGSRWVMEHRIRTCRPPSRSRGNSVITRRCTLRPRKMLSRAFTDFEYRYHRRMGWSVKDEAMVLVEHAVTKSSLISTCDEPRRSAIPCPQPSGISAGSIVGISENLGSDGSGSAALDCLFWADISWVGEVLPEIRLCSVQLSCHRGRTKTRARLCKTECFQRRTLLVESGYFGPGLNSKPVPLMALPPLWGFGEGFGSFILRYAGSICSRIVVADAKGGGRSKRHHALTRRVQAPTIHADRNIAELESSHSQRWTSPNPQCLINTHPSNNRRLKYSGSSLQPDGLVVFLVGRSRALGWVRFVFFCLLGVCI